MGSLNVMNALISFLGPLLVVILFQYLNVRAKKQTEAERKEEEEKAPKSTLVVEARAKAKELILEARDNAIKIKQQAERDAGKIMKEAAEKEKSLAVRETELSVKRKNLQEKEQEIDRAHKGLSKRQSRIDSLENEKKAALEKVATLTRDEAREELLKAFDKELIEEKAKRVRQIEEDIKRNKESIAKEILIDAMRFGATDYVVQYTTSKVALPEDEMKGRIIGKEGRNIKMFEELTGVELDLDSSQGFVIISSFDPIRREVAKVSLERLLTDGRIQPARIEEIIEKTEKEIDQLMYKEGDNLCHRIGAYDVPKELVQMLGRFKYRFSYGQNMIEHTLEETRIAMSIAHELNANVETVKMACLFHDIGKIVTDVEGSHIDLGVDLLKKYKVDNDVVTAVAEHHSDTFSSIESAIVALADHVSGARPGARSEDYESYVERLKSLEEAATSFEGVDKAYAVSAGREVRVFVSPEKVDDDTTTLLARDIAKKIELEQTYPGVVKVTVIREKRVQATAK